MRIVDQAYAARANWLRWQAHCFEHLSHLLVVQEGARVYFSMYTHSDRQLCGICLSPMCPQQREVCYTQLCKGCALTLFARDSNFHRWQYQPANPRICPSEGASLCIYTQGMVR